MDGNMVNGMTVRLSLTDYKIPKKKRTTVEDTTMERKSLIYNPLEGIFLQNFREKEKFLEL